MSEIDVLMDLDRRVKAISDRLDAHCLEHPLGYHDHLLDSEEHASHHASMDKPKEKRAGEQRKGERRTSTEKYEGEEKRVA